MWFSRIVAAGVGLVLSAGTANGQGPNGNGGEVVGPAKCTLNLIEPYMVNASDTSGELHETLSVCDMDPEYEDGVEGISYELEGIPDDFYDDVEYGETTVYISKAGRGGGDGRGVGKHAGGKLKIKEGAMVKKEKVKNGNNGNGSIRGNGRALAGRRRLAPRAGTSTLLVLYAKPLDCQNGKTSQEFADDIFGVNGDAVNARSQIKECSRDQLIYEPACSPGSWSGTLCDNAGGTIVNGVLEVPIDYNITGTASGTVKNYVSAAANNLLKAIHPDLAQSYFTQVMHIIPDCASWGGAAAWAYLPGTVSAFRSSYSNRMGVQVHEFGHNLGLHHSGEGTASYADHSCLMGNPSYGDDGPKICWNGAKSWESTWYDADNLVVDVTAGEQFNGTLVGVADWTTNDYTPGEHKVVIKIPDASQDLDYYVMFNRKKGPNEGVNYAKDKVTVTTGKYKKVSWHQAELGQSASRFTPESFRVADFGGVGQDLVVKVCEIDTLAAAGTPDTASVQIFLDGEGLTELLCPGEVCSSSSECDDSNACTEDICTAEGKCLNDPIIGCGYYLACGSSAGSCKDQEPILAPSTELHEVRCCADQQLGNWHTHGNCPAGVYGESEFGGVCYHAETYSSAASICTNAGGRLCTVQELLSDCTRGSGCSHDSDMIWSSTTATLSPTKAPTTDVPTASPSVTMAPVTSAPTSSAYYLACGSSGGGCSGDTQVAAVGETHEVRCCSDVFKSGWKTHDNCLPLGLWGQSFLGNPSTSDGCYHAETYSSAAAICASHSARLCTVQELLSDCTRGSGCSHDQDMIWSSTEASLTASPTASPVTDAPSASPSASPTRPPVTRHPSSSPSASPTGAPVTSQPTSSPSASPSKAPTTSEPTSSPSASPSRAPATSAPTSSPVSAYYLACGSSGGGCSGQTKAATPDELHEVRCCADQQLGNWHRHGNCPAGVYGESEFGGVCKHAETYSSAASICENAGGRLCTVQELLSDCTRGSGCSHDQDMIWSSNPVVPTAAPTDVPTVAPSSESPTSTMQPTRIGATGETGRVAVSHLGTTVDTRYVYADPVVVAFINTRNGDESVDVRVKDVTSRSFRLFLEEAPAMDGEHSDEEVSYILMEAGRHVLEGDLEVQAGHHDTSTVHRGGQAFAGDEIVFDVPFNSTPAVLTTLNTHNNGAFMSSLATDVRTTDFEISQEALETGTDVAVETIGWMAFSTGVGTTSGGSPYISSYDPDDLVSNGVGQAKYYLDLAPANFTDLPDLVAGLDQDAGLDGAYARGAGDFTVATQTIYAEEDQQKEAERNHASVPVAWVGFGHNSDLFEAPPPTEALGACKKAMDTCEHSYECCSGECLGEGKCMADAASQ